MKSNNTFEVLKQMWDQDLNGRDIPYNEPFDPDTKVWWKCKKKHSWSSLYKSRFRVGCPYCSGRKPIIGENDLASTNPELIPRWSILNNTYLTEHMAGSSKKAWWLCKNGHVFERRISLAAQKFRCDYCESLGYLRPEVSKRWHPTKNGKLTPFNVSLKSAKTVWWQCDQGHEWEARVFSQLVSSCPTCSGFKLVPGHVDIPTLKPWLIPFWSSKNNFPIESVHPETNKQFYWDCKIHNHTWEGRIFNEPINNYNPCKICRGKEVLAGFNDLGTVNPNLGSQWSTNNNTRRSNEFTIYSAYNAWWDCDKNHPSWRARIIDRATQQKTNCPTCAAGNYVSKGEEDIAKYIKGLNLGEVQTSVRNIIRGELDIYIPSKNIAVEFNGLYWHSELKKDKLYHKNKWESCKQQGIQLIQIWEDDWNNNPEQIKSMLAHKLGVTTGRQIYARKTTVRALEREETNVFLSKNHIQGAVDGSIRVGLIEENALSKNIVAVLVLKKEPGQDRQLNLLRFATSEQVIGGFTKLLKYVEKIYQPKSIITFSDNTVSDGGLYESTGFKAIKELPPDYMYVVGQNRVHKFNYRLKRFKNDNSLIYEEGLSERQLANLNKIKRIWDAGKTKWKISF